MFKRSPLLLAATAVVHGATMAIACTLPLPIFVRAGAVGLVALHLGWVWWRHAWRLGAAAIVGMILRGNRTAEAECRSGKRQDWCIDEGSFVSGPLTVIHGYPPDSRKWPWKLRAVLILPDMLDADVYRQLRVLLRLGKAEA